MPKSAIHTALARQGDPGEDRQAGSRRYRDPHWRWRQISAARASPQRQSGSRQRRSTRLTNSSGSSASKTQGRGLRTELRRPRSPTIADAPPTIADAPKGADSLTDGARSSRRGCRPTERLPRTIRRPAWCDHNPACRGSDKCARSYSYRSSLSRFHFMKETAKGFRDESRSQAMILPAFLLAVIWLPAGSPEAPCATAADSAGALGQGTPVGEGITTPSS